MLSSRNNALFASYLAAARLLRELAITGVPSLVLTDHDQLRPRRLREISKKEKRSDINTDGLSVPERPLRLPRRWIRRGKIDTLQVARHRTDVAAKIVKNSPSSAEFHHGGGSSSAGVAEPDQHNCPASTAWRQRLGQSTSNDDCGEVHTRLWNQLVVL